MPDFAHVLMTRFNMPTPGREAAWRSRPDWLPARFDLFERYCLPSVAAQDRHDFTWVIYFDRETPDPFRSRIEALRGRYPFVPYYTGLFDGSGWRRSLAEVLGGLPRQLLTSRLDNDDALACDYMRRTAEAARASDPRPRTGIVITEGYTRSPAGLYRHRHPRNAFASWLERTEDPAAVRTALGIHHMDAPRFGPLVQVAGPGGWMQMIHGGNVSNKVRGVRIGPEGLAGRFPEAALAGLAPVPALARAVEAAFLGPLRALRDGASELRQALRGRGPA